MKTKHILLFVFFIQILIVLHYSLSSWRIPESVLVKLLLLKEVAEYSSNNISQHRIFPERVTAIETFETNSAEKPSFTVELILDIQRNISIKLPVNDDRQISTTNGTYGTKFIPKFSKLIFTRPMYGGLGNQMCKFAALYAMGQVLRRTPAYLIEEMTMRNNEQEIAALFPMFYGMVHYFTRKNLSVRQFELAKTCCDYQDPVVLRNFSEPLLELTGANGINFEHYKYFHSEREKIKEIFNFSQEAHRRVQKIASNMYRGNKSHKLCIHVRTGDFISWHWESKPNTTSEAIKRIAQNFAEKGIDYSLVFLGQDKEFFKQVNLNKQQKRNVFVTPKDISRGDEMCLGATTCDSLLLTAHISTYGFWIGYLMPDNSQIYYIANFKTSKLHTPGQFPPEWVHFDL